MSCLVVGAGGRRQGREEREECRLGSRVKDK